MAHLAMKSGGGANIVALGEAVRRRSSGGTSSTSPNPSQSIDDSPRQATNTLQPTQHVETSPPPATNRQSVRVYVRG